LVAFMPVGVSSSTDATSMPVFGIVEVDVHAVHSHGSPVSVPLPVNAPPVSTIVK
jgi:hypothetical protein